jgi:hypothetical protein
MWTHYRSLFKLYIYVEDPDFTFRKGCLFSLRFTLDFKLALYLKIFLGGLINLLFIFIDMWFIIFVSTPIDHNKRVEKRR